MATVRIGTPEPGATFEHPFDMLAACHERVQASLSLLRRLVDYLREHDCDRHARSAAQDVLRYFNLAAPAHHQDEERHVFPALERSGNTQLAALAEQLRHDHEKLTLAWEVLRPLLQSVVGGDLSSTHARLAGAARYFIELNTAHLMLEDGHAFGPAHAQLSHEGAETLTAMGQEMAQRRGVTAGPAAPGSR